MNLKDVTLKPSYAYNMIGLHVLTVVFPLCLEFTVAMGFALLSEM